MKTAYNLQDAANITLRRESVWLSAYIRQEKSSQIGDLCFKVNELETRKTENTL